MTPAIKAVLLGLGIGVLALHAGNYLFSWYLLSGWKYYIALALNWPPLLSSKILPLGSAHIAWMPLNLFFHFAQYVLLALAFLAVWRALRKGA